MAKYILKRVLYAILSLFVIFTATFFLMNLIPGGPFNSEEIAPEIRERMNAKWGLDQPLYVQYFRYLKRYAQLDFGESLVMSYGASINNILFGLGKWPLSLKMGGASLLLTALLGIPLGCIAAFNRGKMTDNVIRVAAVVTTAMPRFVMSTLLLGIFTIWLGWFPATSGLMDEPKKWVLPLFTMSLTQIFSTSRLVRTSMLDVNGADYIRTAKAKGLRNWIIMFKHQFRNALIPVITSFGPMIAGMFAGSFVVEKTFVIPGIGTYMVGGVSARDYPVIMATTILLSAVSIFMNLMVDICYTLADPRISFESKGD